MMKTNKIDKKLSKRKKRIKKIFKIVDFTLLAFVLFVIINLGFDTFKGEMPRIFNHSISKVETGSMVPVLEVDDFVLIKSVSFDDIKVNDIIVYKSNIYNIFIIHRVVSINYIDRTLVTKGDANSSIDSETISENMISGIYQKTLFNSGGNNLINNKGLVFGILLFVIFLVFIIQAINIIITYNFEKKKLLLKEKETSELAELRTKIIKEELEKIKNKEV